MRYAKLVIGVLLLLKGIKGAIALPSAISVVHMSSAAPGFAAGYVAGKAAGEVMGLVVGMLVVLAGGAILTANGLTAHRSRNSVAPAA